MRFSAYIDIDLQKANIFDRLLARLCLILVFTKNVNDVQCIHYFTEYMTRYDMMRLETISSQET